MIGVLIALAIIFAVLSFLMHRSADRDEERFANRPMVISNPAEDLFTNQKYAIVGLLAYVQGASALSAYSDEAGSIVQSTIFSLGLSPKDVDRYIKVSLNHDPERNIYRIVASLKEIRDKAYLYDLYHKCRTIADISQDLDTIGFVNDVFEELDII